MTNSEPPTVVCFGLTTIDVVQVVQRLPKPDEKIVAETLDISYGGPASNAASTSKALGTRTRLVGVIGDSTLGSLAKAELLGQGVEVIDLAQAGATPAVSTVLVTNGTGERAVVSTNATKQNPSALTGNELGEATVLLVDGHHMSTAIALATAAREMGITTVLDGGSWKEGTGELMKQIDFAVFSNDFRTPSGQGGLEFASGFECIAAVSKGKAPLIVRDRQGQATDVPAPYVPDELIVDTLGAGDVLHGALAHFLAVTPELTPAEVLAAAAEVASESCKHRGAKGWQSPPSKQAEAN